MEDAAGVYRIRCSDLELQLAQAKEEGLRLTRENAELSRAHTSEAKALDRVGAEDKYSMQKRIVTLSDQLEASEGECGRLKDSLSAIESNLNSEISNVRDEAERQALFLRSQLLEAKEMNATLQEKLVASATTSDALVTSGMDVYVTAHILITADSVLHRLLAEKPITSFKTKYDVTGEVSGRTLTLRGRKLNVQLLKAEVLEALNGMYASLTDPGKYVDQTKSKDAARSVEMEHLRRTVATYESTVASLHTALQHAQEKSHEADDARQKLLHQKVVSDEAVTGQLQLAERKVAELGAEIAARDAALEEADTTNQLALASLKAEAQVTAEFRSENEKLKLAVQQAVDAKELAERAAYSAREQSRATQFTIEDLSRQGQSAEAERRRGDTLQAQNRSLSEELDALRRSSTAALESHSMEKGKLGERLSILQKETATLKAELKDSHATVEQLRAELQASHEATLELRRRTGDGRRDLASPKTDLSRLTSLEEENLTLRRELQEAFDDLRAVAGAMKDSRSVREKAVKDIEAMEVERTRLMEERQALEVDLVKERMNFKAREADHLMSLTQAREEAAHQRRRAEMLHEEYQRRIQEAMGEDKPNDSSKLPRPSAKGMSNTPTRLVSAR